MKTSPFKICFAVNFLVTPFGFFLPNAQATVPTNSPPTISPIANQVTLVNTRTLPIPFTIDDAETPADQLIVGASIVASPPALVAGITFGGSGTNRTIAVTPEQNFTGQALITIVASDGNSFASQQFTVVVVSCNQPPTISTIENQTTRVNQPTPPIPFRIAAPCSPLSRRLVTGVSSNTSLVPNENILFSGTSNTWEMIIVPALNKTGDVIISVSFSVDGFAAVTTTFHLQILPENLPPTISPIANQVIPVNTRTLSIPFTIDDAETPANRLIVGAGIVASPSTLLTSSGITFGGSGTNRTITVTPEPGFLGSAIITVLVSDGSSFASQQFTVFVTACNQPMTIAKIEDQTIYENQPTAPIPLIVTDVCRPFGPHKITVTPISLDPTPLNQVSDKNIQIHVNDDKWEFVFTPSKNQTGEVVIEVFVQNFLGFSTGTSFRLRILPGNFVPKVLEIANQVIPENTQDLTIPFFIRDADTPLDQLVIGASVLSSPPQLVTAANVVLGGSGSNRTITVNPAPDITGEALITISVSHGVSFVTKQFTIVVIPVSSPDVSKIADQTTIENHDAPWIPFTVQDPNISPSSLIVTASSSNLELVADANLLIGGTGTNRALLIRPTPHQTGKAIIKITLANNDIVISSTSFTLSVTPEDLESWRARVFSPAQLADYGISSDNADPDHDGATNAEEFRAGTEPLDAKSVLALGVRAVPLLSWPSIPNKRYVVQRKAAAAGANWLPLAAIAATNALTTFVDTSNSTDSLYRVEIAP